MFQFMGGEIVLVTAGEAKRPMRDLPTAARYMYLLPSSFYLVAILLVGLNINYLDPRLYHAHASRLLESRLDGIQTAASSPFVIIIENAAIRALPGFLDACFIFSALTAAIKFYNRTIDRNGKGYRDKHYRAHWQPLWAILGLALCTLLMIFSGWAAIYDLSAKTPGINRGDLIVDLVAAYLGARTLKLDFKAGADLSLQPCLFFTILITYKLVKRTRIRSIVDDMRDVWFVRYAPLDEEDLARPSKRKKNSGFREFLRWVK
ncbi:MAG: hypothetical protein Q9220_006400 [cf. Caloplaca sp. 1 TL-2023]